MREDQPLARASQRHRATAVRDLERTEDPEHEVARDGARGRGRRAPRRLRHRQHVDRPRESLQSDGPAILEPDPLDGAREVHQLGRHQDLAAPGARAESRREVHGASAEPIPDRDRLARVQSDPDTEHLPLRRFRGDARLDLERRAERLPRRVEDRQHLVPADLDDRPRMPVDALTSDREEAFRHIRRGLIAVRVAQGRVPAEVGDQERPDHGPVSILRLTRSRFVRHASPWPSP